MMSTKAAWPWLPVLAVLIACPAFGEDLEPFGDYQPPPQLFEEQQPTADNSIPGFLTAIEGAEPEKPDPGPKAPSKPVAPKPSKKIDRIIASKPNKPKATAPLKAVSMDKPKVKSKTHLESGERLVNPTARDILASIEGVTSAKSKGDRTTLAFIHGESRLTLDMKNDLLRNHIPKLKQNRESGVEIQAYTPAENAADANAQRVSLARAIEVQDFLQAAGVDSSRISVMPLANQRDSASANRVDLVIKNPAAP
jgi:outer membrane protein OmpA-like peptidoglycan-associated protein